MNNVEFIAHLESVEGVVRSAEDAIRHAHGWSMVRLGDGELQLFQSLRAGKAGGVVRDAKDGSPGRWKNRFMPNVDWKTAAEDLLKAVPQADVVGLPYSAFWKPGAMGVHLILEEFGLDWRKMTLTGTAVVQILCARPDLMKRLCRGLKVGLAYRHLEIGRDRFLKAGVPLHEQFKYEGQPHGEVVEFFLGKECEVVWMCGGPYGKSCCVELQKAGIVAVDIGQGLEKSLGRKVSRHA